MYKLTIDIDDNSERLHNAFKPEEHKSKRSELKVEKKRDNTKIIVTANDATALKAITNSVTNLLEVYEKI